jgi:hypothetical protein
MRNISLFAVAVALIATGFGAWVASSALVAPSTLEQMLNGKKLSTLEVCRPYVRVPLNGPSCNWV